MIFLVHDFKGYGCAELRLPFMDAVNALQLLELRLRWLSMTVVFEPVDPRGDVPAFSRNVAPSSLTAAAYLVIARISGHRWLWSAQWAVRDLKAPDNLPACWGETSRVQGVT